MPVEYKKDQDLQPLEGLHSKLLGRCSVLFALLENIDDCESTI